MNNKTLRPGVSKRIISTLHKDRNILLKEQMICQTDFLYVIRFKILRFHG